MYPRLPEFRALRAELDPNGMLASDLSRRLGLLARHQAAAGRLSRSEVDGVAHYTRT